MRQAVTAAESWELKKTCLNYGSPLAAALGRDQRWAQQQGDQLGGSGNNPGKRQGWLGSGWLYWIGGRWLNSGFILNWIEKMSCQIGRRPGKKRRGQEWLRHFDLNKWKDGMARYWDEEDRKVRNSVLLFAFGLYFFPSEGRLWFMSLEFEGCFVVNMSHISSNLRCHWLGDHHYFMYC